MVKIVPANPVPVKGFEPSPAERRRTTLANIMAGQQPSSTSGYVGTVQQAAGRDPIDLAGSADLASILAQHAASSPPNASDGSTLSRLGDQIASARVAKPGFFEHGGTGGKILHAIGEASLPIRATIGDPFALQTLMGRARRAQALREDTRRAEDRRWAVEDRDAKANAPQYFNAGRDRVRLDPVTGASEVVYDAPEDYESYADTLGLHPGDEGYDGAVRDYVLRGNGPTSQAARLALDRARQVDRLALEGTRQANRQTLRSSPTYANLHPTARRPGGGGGAPKSASAVVAPILLKMARGGTLTPGEQQALAYSRGGRGGGRGGDLPVLSSPAEVAKLPSGTRFKTPDGRTKVAP